MLIRSRAHQAALSGLPGARRRDGCGDGRPCASRPPRRRQPRRMGSGPRKLRRNGLVVVLEARGVVVRQFTSVEDKPGRTLRRRDAAGKGAVGGVAVPMPATGQAATCAAENAEAAWCRRSDAGMISRKAGCDHAIRGHVSSRCGCPIISGAQRARSRRSTCGFLRIDAGIRRSARGTPNIASISLPPAAGSDHRRHGIIAGRGLANTLLAIASAERGRNRRAPTNLLKS